MADEQQTPTQVPRRSASRAAWIVTGVLLLAVVVITAIGSMRPPAAVRKQERALANVETVTIRTEVYHEGLVLPARLKADHQVTVSAELAGTLASWLVDEGAPVKEGQLVARLQTDTLEATLGQLQAQQGAAEAGVGVARSTVSLAKVGLDKAEKDAASLSLDLRAAQSRLDLARKDHDRTLSLVKDQVISQSEADASATALTQAEVAVAQVDDAIRRAQLGVAGARAGLAQAEGNLIASEARVKELAAGAAGLQVTLRKTELKAPVSGRLDKHLVQAGEVVAPGQALARVYDLAYVRAHVDVGDRFAPFLDAQNETMAKFVELTMPGARREVRAKLILPGMPKLTGGHYQGLELPAEVAYVAQAADPLSNTFAVELRLLNPGEALKEGLIVQARLDYLTYPEAVTIPVRAVEVTDAGPRVLIVTEQQDPAKPEEPARTCAAVRGILPISVQGDRLLIAAAKDGVTDPATGVVSGLRAGDRLIVAGGKGVVHGEEVRVLVADGAFQQQANGAAAAPGGSAAGKSGP